MAISQEEFLVSCDDNGRRVYSRVLDLAQERSMRVKLGDKSFSLWENVGQGEVWLVECYHPGFENGGQGIWTVFNQGERGEWDKIGIRMPEETIQHLLQKAEDTGLFEQAGQGRRCLIKRWFTDAELDSLLAWLERVSESVRQHQGS